MKRTGDRRRRAPDSARGRPAAEAAKAEERPAPEAAGGAAGGDAPRPPELPADWLEQIKSALKKNKRETILATIAGSSVLGTALAICGDYLLAGYKSRLELGMRVEEAKVLEDRKRQSEELDERRAAYKKLDEQLGKLDERLIEYVSTCKKITIDPSQPKFVHYAENSWDELTDQMQHVLSAENECKKLNPDDRETPERVEKITGRLGLNLLPRASKASKAKNPELIEMHGEIQQAIRETREWIEDKRKELRLAQPKT